MAQKDTESDFREWEFDWRDCDLSQLGDHFTGDEDDKAEHEQHLAQRKLESYLRNPWCCR